MLTWGPEELKSLDEFLNEEGILEEVTDMALERFKVMKLVEALREIRALTWRKSLPITDEIKQIATDALRFTPQPYDAERHSSMSSGV